MTRDVTIYKTGRNGEIVKLHGRATARVSYDSVIGTPMHQRTLNTYYDLECSGQLSDADFREFGGKARVAEIHKQALTR